MAGGAVPRWYTQHHRCSGSSLMISMYCKIRLLMAFSQLAVTKASYITHLKIVIKLWRRSAA